MSVVYVCDRAGCGAGALGIFDGHGWRPPAGWRSLLLDDWEVHGCCDECFSRAIDEMTGLTPASATREWAKLRGIRFGPPPVRAAGPPPPLSFEVPQKPPGDPPS